MCGLVWELHLGMRMLEFGMQMGFKEQVEAKNIWVRFEVEIVLILNLDLWVIRTLIMH